jgi:hypothetical protein
MQNLYRSLLKQLTRQYESKNGNRIWRSILSLNFRQNPSNLSLKDGENILHYLQGAGEYNRLMALYWPESSLSESEKISKTANRVGLSVPSDLSLGEESNQQDTIISNKKNVASG